MLLCSTVMVYRMNFFLGAGLCPDVPVFVVVPVLVFSICPERGDDERFTWSVFWISRRKTRAMTQTVSQTEKA